MLQPSAPAREPRAWIHAPSQPLMQSPLSQFQTPTAPRRVSRFFRVWLPFRLPCRADHSAYFGWTNFILPILSAVDVSQAKQLLDGCQRNSQRNREISVNVIVENAAPNSLPAQKRNSSQVLSSAADYTYFNSMARPIPVQSRPVPALSEVQ
jgi:hypothetical protein